MGLGGQFHGLSASQLRQRSHQVLSQDVPRHAVDGYMVTDHQQAVAIVGMQQHRPPYRSVLQVNLFTFADSYFCHLVCHVGRCGQCHLFEGKQVLVCGWANHDAIAYGGTQHVVMHRQRL